MKKIAWTGGAVLLFMAMACTGNKGAAGEKEQDTAAVDSPTAELNAPTVKSDTLVFENIHWEDSVAYKVKILDYSSDEEPTPYTVETTMDRYEKNTLKAVGGPADAMEFINQWLTLDAAGETDNSFHTAADVAAAYKRLKAEKGVADVQAVLEQEKHQASEMTDDEDAMEEMAFLSNNESSSDLTVQWQAKGVLTLWDSGYDYYAGAAHGMPWGYGKTFDLKNLRILTFDDIFLPKGRKALLKMVVDQLQDEYADGWSMANAVEDIDFPSVAPSLVGEGVQFCYGAYEIGAYALGLPSTILPYKKVQQYLTPEVKELLSCLSDE